MMQVNEDEEGRLVLEITSKFFAAIVDEDVVIGRIAAANIVAILAGARGGSDTILEICAVARELVIDMREKGDTP